MGYCANIDSTRVLLHLDFCRHADNRSQPKRGGKWVCGETREEAIAEVRRTTTRQVADCQVCLG